MNTSVDINDEDIIEIDGGKVFRGTRKEFKVAYFQNAYDPVIRMWAKIFNVGDVVITYKNQSTQNETQTYTRDEILKVFLGTNHPTDEELLKTDFSKEARCRIEDWRNYYHGTSEEWVGLSSLKRLAIYITCYTKAMNEEWD